MTAREVENPRRIVVGVTRPQGLRDRGEATRDDTKGSGIVPMAHQIRASKDLRAFSGRLIGDERGCGKTVTGIMLLNIPADIFLPHA